MFRWQFGIILRYSTNYASLLLDTAKNVATVPIKVAVVGEARIAAAFENSAIFTATNLQAQVTVVRDCRTLP